MMQPTSNAPAAPAPSGASNPARELAVVRRLLGAYQQALGHDLPNKLVALQGLAGLLEQECGGSLAGEARACLERLITLSRQLHSQVNTLADVGRTCRAPGPVVPVSLDELLAEVQASINYHRPGRLALSSDGPLPTVLLPRPAARRVLLELLEFGARRAAPLRVRLTWNRSATGTTTLVLHDDGPALTATHLEQAFEPGIPSGDGADPGLGLFLARLLADGWGGSLELAAPPEGGCLWTVEIPHPPMETRPQT